jgi:methyl-accepting chemotaxis protein
VGNETLGIKWHIGRWVKRSFSSRFEVEARAHAPLIPILSRQLKETVGSIETSAGEVCANFGQMANLARSAAGLGSALVDQNGSATVTDAVEECRAMLGQLSDRLENSGELYARAIRQMELANSSVQRVFGVLQQLDQASFTSRIVALNAKIEAVHLGSLGTGFEVVAEQISSQAIRSSQLTEHVVSLLQELTQTMNHTTSELKDLAEADKSEAGRSRETAGQTLSKLEQASARMQQTVAESCRASETLYEQISKAIVNMQFQDRVSQRLGHVIDSLDAMTRALGAESGTGANTPTVEERTQQVAAELAATYTMPSERAAHSSGDAAETAPDAGGDIELF